MEINLNKISIEDSSYFKTPQAREYYEYAALLKKFTEYEDETRSVLYSTGESELDDFIADNPANPAHSCESSPENSRYADGGSFDNLNDSFLSMNILDSPEEEFEENILPLELTQDNNRIDDSALHKLWNQIRGHFVKYLSSQEAKKILKSEMEKYDELGQDKVEFWKNMKILGSRIPRKRIGLCVCKYGENSENYHIRICQLFYKLFIRFASHRAESLISHKKGLSFEKRTLFLEVLAQVQKSL